MNAKVKGYFATIIADPDCCEASKVIARKGLRSVADLEDADDCQDVLTKARALIKAAQAVLEIRRMGGPETLGSQLGFEVLEVATDELLAAIGGAA